MVWWWVVGAAVVAVGALIGDDNSSSSGTNSSSSVSGPSRKALKQAEVTKIKEEAELQCGKFLRAHDQLGLAHGQSGKQLYMDACAALHNDPLVAESFSGIAEVALLDAYYWEDILTIKIDHLRSVRDRHPQCGPSVARCLDMLCGLHAWDPEPNANATLQSLTESSMGIVAELQQAAASFTLSPSMRPRFLVLIPRELPALFMKRHQAKALLHAIENIELYEDTDIITEYAALQPVFAEQLAQWRVLAAAESDPYPRVVVCGLLKAGKSTLLNMLTEHYDEECFPSARTRKTTNLQTALHGHICYVDTPGLDAPEADENAAWSAFASAEKVLFVVSAEQDLEQAELQILKRLAAERDDFAEVCTVVVTHIDALGFEAENMIRKLQSVRTKIMQTTGADLPVFSVSCTTYCKGIVEIKPALRRRGGIDILREHVQLVHAGNLIESRAERMNGVKQCMRAPVYQELAVIERDVRKFEDTSIRQNNAMADEMNLFLSGLRSKLYTYDNMLEEMP